jgi:beta-lactamase regulating signal transducer with metallopeptidase domain
MSTSTDLMSSLAWSLLHFLWQGAAIAALAGAAMSLFRESTTRYLIGVSALALMVLAFGATFALLYGAPAGAELAADTRVMSSNIAPAAMSEVPALSTLELPAARELDFVWIARGWLGGVALLALRIAFGLLLLEHLRRRNLLNLPPEMVERCRALQQRLGISRVVRYCECHLVAVPSVIGFFRPVVLLPVRALTGLTPEQLEAVIAHELGHVKRFDVAVNFFQVVVETLFFFHPAVWWLNKRIRTYREDCCDDIAIAVGGRNVSYARALAAMEDWRNVPELAMGATGGDVAARVARLLGMRSQKNGAQSAGVVTAALVLAAALTAGVTSIGLAGPTPTAPAVASSLAQVGAQADEPLLLAQAEPRPVERAEPVRAEPAEPARAEPAEAPRGEPRAVEPRPAGRGAPRAVSRDRPRRDTASEPPGRSFIDQMKSAGFDVSDVEQLIALKIHDVTPEYVRGLREAGFQPDVEGIVAMKIHGVTPEYVAEFRELGLAPDFEGIIALNIHDVTPEYVAQVRALGVDADFEELIALKIHDITPEFIEEARAQGFEDLDVEELVELKIADVL